MDIFKTPRDAAVAAQRNPVLWPGTEERFTGYGVMGLPFRSGHYLAMRHIPASSIGPEYRTVWHYAPDGTWTFITDRRPERTYARYFAPGDSALTLYADIASEMGWTALVAGNRARHARLANRARIHPRYGDDDRIVTPATPNRLAQQCFSAGGECGRRSAVAGWTRRYERHSLVGRAELRKRKL